MINAILCENRYGEEISNSLSKINKYQKVVGFNSLCWVKGVNLFWKM
jgi:hypothetical protein